MRNPAPALALLLGASLGAVETPLPPSAGPGAIAVGETAATARVYAIDKSARVLTLVGPGGQSAAVFAPPGLPGFDLLQPGATVDARWTEPVALGIQRPDVPPPPAGQAARLAPKSGVPPDVVAPVQTALGVIQTVDRVNRVIVFKPQTGGALTLRVIPDVAELAATNGGDSAVVAYVPPMLLSVAPHAGH